MSKEKLFDGSAYSNLNEKKFYYCRVAWSAEKCGKYNLKTLDYIDLRKLDRANTKDRRVLAMHSMVRSIDEESKMICCDNGRNQEYFEDKREIYEGVKEFILANQNLLTCDVLEDDTICLDDYYGCCFNKGIELSENIKRSFYNDNSFMNRFESSLFE